MECMEAVEEAKYKKTWAAVDVGQDRLAPPLVLKKPIARYCEGQRLVSCTNCR